MEKQSKKYSTVPSDAMKKAAAVTALTFAMGGTTADYSIRTNRPEQKQVLNIDNTSDVNAHRKEIAEKLHPMIRREEAAKPAINLKVTVSKNDKIINVVMVKAIAVESPNKERELAPAQISATRSKSDSFFVGVKDKADSILDIMLKPFSSPVYAQSSATLAFSPTTLPFPNTVVGATYLVGQSLQNTGSATATITSNSLTDNVDFSVAGVPSSIAASGKSTIKVTFKPQSDGPLSSTFSIVSNASNSPTTEQFSGCGVPSYNVELNWQPSSSPSVSGYDVYKSQNGAGGPFTLVTASKPSVTGTSYNDTQVVAGGNYWYEVTTYDPTLNPSQPESGPSNVASASPPAPAGCN